MASFEVYAVQIVGRLALVAVPALQDSWPVTVKRAIQMRREATLYGRCGCGATFGELVVGPEGAVAVEVLHERMCPASTESLAGLFRHAGIELEP